MRLLFISYFLLLSFPFWAQAEYQKVREMFDVPHTNIEMHVFKGHLDHVHPVEFFIGKRNENVKGYYRLVSSGDVFFLEGEWENAKLILSESDENDQQIGTLVSSNFNFDENVNYELQWQSMDNTDVLDISLLKTHYSSYSPLAFKSSISKYCDYQTDDCFTVEVFEENKAEIVFLAYAKREFISLVSQKPFIFYTSDSLKYEEFSDKLRVKKQSGFQFYTKEKQAEVKRIYYASNELLSDVEYLILNEKAFDDFLIGEINKEKARTKAGIAKVTQENNSLHYQCKWSGWTMIDYMGTTVISGRIILESYMPSYTERKVIPFTYDLQENESTTVKEQFKSDVDIVSFFNKRIVSELQTNLDLKGKKAEEFLYYSLSDKYILITTAHNPADGFSTIKIPYSELKNWVKRNSLIKKIMRV